MNDRWKILNIQGRNTDISKYVLELVRVADKKTLAQMNIQQHCK
jgi:hypothetical protein